MNVCLNKLVAVPFSGTALLVLSVALSVGSPATAAELKNISDIQGCRAIRSEKERLACYDTVLDGGIFNEEKAEQVRVEEFGSEKMPKPPAEEPAPATVTPAPAPVAEPPRPAPAAEAPAAAAPAEPVQAPPSKVSDSGDRLSVTIVRSRKGNYGIYYFQTDDGQVWQQINAQRWTDKPPYDATIKKGILGTYFLVTEGGKSTRVRRVK